MSLQPSVTVNRAATTQGTSGLRLLFFLQERVSWIHAGGACSGFDSTWSPPCNHRTCHSGLGQVRPVSAPFSPRRPLSCSASLGPRLPANQSPGQPSSDRPGRVQTASRWGRRDDREGSRSQPTVDTGYGASPSLVPSALSSAACFTIPTEVRSKVAFLTIDSKKQSLK